MKRVKRIEKLLKINKTGKVYELQVTGSTGGDRTKGIPSQKTVKKHELKSSHLTPKVKEIWITTGQAMVGDLTLTSSEELTLTNNVEYDSIEYEIIKLIENKMRMGTYYIYILRRIPK